ncbi:uncharacterized protein LOC113868341 isoform X2 [Abrus precatorius]|uniref:Uncharacterized protein LOC113868341 isoform X2 n=1 Tax=Abrus precatorius TaxID=3816 RepID=A0A8B8LXI5_ABRPR|nr:uncharacterized protein LOC113868341 isoform X2 [Abrus precatorius]
MYNQVNRGTHFGQSSVPAVPPPPPPPPYQQALPHFHQFPPPPPPNVYLHGPTPPTSSSPVPLNLPIQGSHNVMPNAGQSYVIPSQLHHGNTVAPQMSWAPGPPARTLPPPPQPPSASQGQILYNPPFHPPPPQPGDVQNMRSAPPPPPPSVYLHSTVGNYQVPPPLPSSPPPVPPSPPPLTPPMTSVSSHATRADDAKMFGLELKSVDSVDGVVASHTSGVVPVCNSDSNWDGGSYREVAVAARDEDLLPPKPTEEKTVKKIEALCQLIAANGADVEDKTRRDEFRNPEYAFLFGGDPGSEAAISHTYFLWMKKKYNLDTEWHEKKRESPMVDSSGKQYHMHVATVSADSDMEMEDDITLSDKGQGSNYATEALTQPHNRLDEMFNMNQNIQQLQNSIAKDVSSCDVSYFGSIRVSKQNEGSVTKVCSPVNDSTKVAEFLLGTVLEKSTAPGDKDFMQTGISDHKETINPDKDRLLVRSGSLKRLLQNYASDDASDNEDDGCAADANVFTVSGGADIGVLAAHKDSGISMETSTGSKNPSSTQKEFRPPSKTSRDDPGTSPCIVQESKTRKRYVSRWTSDECIEHNLENQVSVNFAALVESFHGKDGLEGTGIDCGNKSTNGELENEGKTSKHEPNVLKVDEFGRHLRECLTDSDSDDSRNLQTRKINKRDRSWGHSQSPPDRRGRRRRRRRSPWRRKDKRNRSRSWSPRQHRSRSRSPILRLSGDFRGENVKRDKGQCMNFFRGKCYRGASCKYAHHESEINATSKRHRNKQDLEVRSHAKEARINEGMENISSKGSDYEHGGIRNQDVNLCNNLASHKVVQKKEDSGRHAVVSITACLDGQSVNNSDPSKSEGFREAAPEMQETIGVMEEPKALLIHENDRFQKAGNSHQRHLVDGFNPEALSSGDASKTSGTYKDVIPSEDGLFVVQQIQPKVSVGVPEYSGYPSQLIYASFVTDSSPDKRSIVSATANEVYGSEPLPYMLPSTQGENTVHMPQISRQHGGMQQSAFFPFQSTAREKFEPYPAPLHTQNSHFSVTPNSTWTSLPPPPPLPPSRAMYNSSLNSGVAKSHVSSEFNQSQLHLRTDFVSQTPTKPGLPTHSLNSEFQDQAYLPMQDHSRTFMHTEPFSPKHLPQGNPPSQLLSGSNINREDLNTPLSMQDSKFSSYTSFGGLHSQSKQFSWESDVNRPQPSLGGRLSPEGHFMTSSQIHSLSQKQQSMYNFQCPASDVNLGVPGETVTVSRYPPDSLDSNHSTSLPTIGGSRISAHYNPYASTFEKPLSSKFSSSIYRQESEIIHGNNYASSRLNHTPINRTGDGGVGSRQSASPKSARGFGQILPRSGGDQYDPLFDSIEPSSSLRKNDFDQKQEVTGESNISLRPKSSHMSLDMDEKNKHEEVGAVASTTSQNNDEYGETADAEVGVVENESLSNDVDVAKMTTGDVEINQIKSPGKRKKSKESRSMKLFKISIANFVKEVLKPSWQQGNMSKVAFKTIVKKTVDKVSGAMKGHRVPKSQAKISQYIDSSQRKLTKLVMGYVDKYVKV